MNTPTESTYTAALLARLRAEPPKGTPATAPVVTYRAPGDTHWQATDLFSEVDLKLIGMEVRDTRARDKRDAEAVYALLGGRGGE